MREHIETLSRQKIDLDNPETYKHLPNSMNELDGRVFYKIGYSICYMDFWHPEVFNKEKIEPDMSRDWTLEEIAAGWPDAVANFGYYQRQRVYKLIENFTKNRHNNWGNILWFKEQVFLIEDEIENMC